MKINSKSQSCLHFSMENSALHSSQSPVPNRDKMFIRFFGMFGTWPEDTARAFHVDENRFAGQNPPWLLSRRIRIDSRTNVREIKATVHREIDARDPCTCVPSFSLSDTILSSSFFFLNIDAFTYIDEEDIRGFLVSSGSIPNITDGSLSF